jgi:U3 small nucleolar ribonucleoprotein component
MIIDEIQTRQNTELSVTAAIEKVELVHQQENLSLYELYKLLHKSDKSHYMRENIRL